MRAVFEIEVRHHNTYHVISNTNVVNLSDAVADEFKTTKFLPTERISVDSVAIIVSKFKSISTAKLLKVEMYGNDSFINACYLKDAMDAAFDGINLFYSYFKSAHNLTSLKLVTVPGIATEISTYELIIYNQYHLIYQSARMTTTQIDKMVRSITRTFAQQFFGNIVNMTSSNETFITGGFVRFYEFLFADMLKPEDRIMDVYNVNVLHRALEMDSLITTESMNEKKGDDIIQYTSAKFSTLLRMFEDVIGPDKLKQKILNFLFKYKFQLATPENFYDEFEDEDGGEYDFKEIFRFWSENPGYPVIEIIDKNETSITIAQERFLIFIDEDTDRANVSWTIPITYLTSNGETNEEPILMDSDIMTLNVLPYDWIILNVNQIGYYRVNYDPDVWMMIIVKLNSLHFEDIPVLNRAAIIDDAFNLAIAKKISYGYLFGILSYLRYEYDVIPWKAASHCLQFLDMQLSEDEEVYKCFKEFVIEIVEPLYNRVGLNSRSGESSFDREVREIAIFWMCKMEFPDCVSYVNSKFHEFIENPHNIHPDIQLAVLCNAIRNADFDTFKKLWNSMLDFTGNREILIKSLACTENFEAFVYIGDHLRNPKFSNRDVRLMLINFVQNYKHSVYIVNAWLGRHLLSLDTSEQRFMLHTVLKRINNKEKLILFKSFEKKFTNTGNYIQDTMDLFIKTSEQIENWLKENQEEILTWLNKHLKPSVPESTTEYVKTTESTESTDITTPDGANNNCNSCYILIFVTLMCHILKVFSS
ncbi:aminopeptidase N-like [Chironomus tepperi]|uniref:aminopeptidase N-like n=1 Tax=Chironomus tepperi TaxID=113505 RepID=UPI00391F6263